MGLIRRIWLLWALSCLLLGLGTAGVTLWRANLQALDAADVLARAHLALLQQQAASGTPLALEMPAKGMGWRVVGERGQVLGGQPAEAGPAVPVWFSAALAWGPRLQEAPVRWQGQPARLQVLVDTATAQAPLWSLAGALAGGWALFCALSAWLTWAWVARIRGPLQSILNQAQALMERRFTLAPEPNLPEWREMSRAMNSMVERLKTMFEEQTAQVDSLRRLAHCDGLTGLSNRPHFLGRLKSLLCSEDGSAGGALVLVRLCDLQNLNRQLGRLNTDRLLRQTTDCLLESAARWPGHEAGRLNGSDFALVLPDVQALREPAVDISARLRSVLKPQGVVAVVSVVRWWHGAPVSGLLAAADHALARAEARAPFAVEMDDGGDGLTLGEDSWTQRLEAALQHRRFHLVRYPVVDAAGQIVHWECPLRLELEPGGPLVPAAEWLPRARRAGLTGPIDLSVAELALQAIARDGHPRAVNVSIASLHNSALLPGLRALLQAHADAAPGLWLELPEAGAYRHLTPLRELVALAHTHGALVGLEHAGEDLEHVAELLETGLDFVKLDASLTEGVAANHAGLQHMDGVVHMLRGIGVKVYAEGVVTQADADALWRCGVDGITGPLVTAA
ncbi:EAL domain-containing protein [Ideonella livida]|uniref:EAL domain-containing protein n=1 Tax=Ideonella livida TaxID=2707176 RepID=A0A7C9PHX1_9BURK|nr:GGDEF domain-containing protein [Ideonella livida]NDY92209.1 EAL domain-containing protein [Ideonella livida]